MPAALECLRTCSASCCLNPGLTVTSTRPANAAPNSIMIHSGMFGAQTATRSPGSNRFNSACAVRTEAEYNSAYVHCRRAAGSGAPQINASRSGAVSAAHANNPPKVSSRTSGSTGPTACDIVNGIANPPEAQVQLRIETSAAAEGRVSGTGLVVAGGGVEREGDLGDDRAGSVDV